MSKHPTERAAKRTYQWHYLPFLSLNQDITDGLEPCRRYNRRCCDGCFIPRYFEKRNPIPVIDKKLRATRRSNRR